MIDRGAHGRDDLVNWEILITPRGYFRWYGEPVTNLQRERVSWSMRHPAKNKEPAKEVGRLRGEPELRPKVIRKSEGRI